MAWFAAVALAVSGLTFYQGAQAPQAGAVTLTGGWDGVFKRDQLWSVNTPTLVGITGGQSADGGGWEKPWEPAQLTSANRTQWMDASGSANGAGLSLHSTIAVGPLFKAEGDSELAMVTFSPGRYMRVIGPRTVTGGTVKLDATEWAELASTDELGDYCQVASAYGGEVNQKNGYLYVTGRAAFAWEGDNTTGQTDFHSSIYQLWKNQTFKCLVSSRGKLLRPKSGKSINQQWQEQFGSSVTGNWTITSDIAIDTYGNFYLWGRNADDKHVLLSMQPPKNEDGSYFAGGDWYYEVVKFFTTNAANDATGGGMAFMNGKLYIYLSNNRMQEWDPLSGAVVDKGVVSTGNRDIDLASAQMAPVLQGTVYNDADGDGVIAADEVGAPNVEVEIWQQTGSATPVRKGSITTNTDGNYYALLPSDTDNFYLRVKQPQIGGVNALQTYASGGTFTYDTDGDGREDAATETNTVTPLCQGAGGDYSPRPGSGPCAGARADWVDPTDLANPLAATGGAAFVTKIDMNSDMAMAIADFAFTAAGSFGDAGPAGAAVTERTRSTAADAGPVHVNTVETAVTLGTVGGVYADGVNHAASDAHASDDGVFLRLDNGSLALAQDRLLSAGRTYALEAHVRVAAGHGSVQTVNVAGWIAANNAANAMIPSSATAVGFGQPNGQGVATASLTVPASPSPTGGLSASTLRVAASTQAGITAPDNTTGQYAPQPGGSSANGRPWVSDGEIEDYRYHVVTGQVRVALVSQGGTVANAPYTVSNAAATAPSATGGTLKTVAADQAWTSPAQHAISNTGAATTVTLTSVPAGHTVVGGACLDSTSGADPWGATTAGHLPVADKPVVSGQSITIPAGTYGTPGPNNLWNDLTCTLTIGKMPSAAASEFTLSPADGKAQVGADVTGTVVVRDASAAVMSGMTVRLASDDARVTLKDSAGQAITSCVTDGQGACQVRVSSDVAATYANVVHATVQEVAGGPWAEVGPAAVAAKRSPKTVAFTAGNWPSAAKSELAVSPPGPVKAGEDYTLAATLYDGVGGANGGRGNLISGATVTFSVDAGQDFGSKGFSAPTCTSDSAGRCQVTFSSSKPGTFNLHALVADREQADHRLTDVGVTSPQARVVTVADVSAANSSLTVTPNAVVGRSAAVTLTLKDAYDNPVTGLADAQLNTGVAPTGPVLSALAETPADSGVYTGTLTSQTNGTHTVSAQPSPLAQALTASTEFSWRTLPTDGTSVLAVTPNPARAGSSLTAALVVKDRLGRAVPGLGDVLTLTSPGMADISTLPTESPAGTYTWHADAVEAAGPYQALVQDGATGSVTGDYVLTQVASAANSSVVISDNGQGRQANDTHFYTVTVSLRDLTDVPIADGMDDAPDGQPKLSLVGPTNTDYTIWDLAHAGAGVYTAKIKASAAANYTLTASYDRGQNAVVLGSVTARFSSPIPSADHSSFTVSTGDQVVGTGQHTVTVTLRNDQDQPVEVPVAQLSGSRALPSAVVGAFAPVAGQPGVYQAPITATVAGLKTVEVVWTDGTSTVAVPPATAGQDKVMFVPGPAVDPLGTFSVTTGNKLTNGTAFHEAWVMFVDQHGNPRPGDSATFTLLDDAETATATSGARFDDADSGSFQVTVQADATGRAAVKTLSRVPTPEGKTGFPVQASIAANKSVVKYVPFSPETANPAHSSFTVTPATGTKVADGKESFAGEIALKDANDLPVPGATASVTVCRVVNASTCTPTTDVAVTAPDSGPANLVASRPDGKINVLFTSVKAGAYQVTAKIGEDPIGAAPTAKTIQFVAGPADPTRSSLIWSPAPVVANGTDTNQVQALVKDAHDNIVADGTQVSFQIPAGVKAGSTAGATTVAATTTNGYATILLTSVKAATYTVTATVGGANITGNAPALLQFGNGPVSASESVLSITTTGSKVADGTQFHTARVELKDAHGNPVVNTATVVEFCWNVAGLASPCQDATSAVAGGKAFAAYNITSLKAGTLTVTAKIKATGDAVSPATGVTASFVAGPPDADASTLTTSQGRVTNNGTATHWAQALITDANGNPTGGVTVTFTVTGDAKFAGGQTTTTTRTAGPDGKAKVEVTNLVEETATVAAAILQGEVGTGPLWFGPGDVDPTKSTFTVTPAGSIPVSDGADANHFTATVTLRDSANAAVAGEAVTLEFSGPGPKLVGGGTTCTTAVNGTCVARVYSSQADTWQAKATIDGGAVQIGAEQPVAFTAGDVEASRSALTAQSGAATADGAQTRWVEALVRDRFDNPVPGATVAFTFPAQATLALGSSPTVTGADGKARIELASTTAGGHTVSAQAARDGAPVGLAPDVRVEFQAGAASAANSTLTVPTAVGGATKVADGVEAHRARVQVRDAHDNPVGAGVAVAFTLTPPGGGAAQQATATTNAQGVAVVDQPSVKAGVHTFSATINAQAVGAGNNTTARFVPGPFDPARSTFQVTGDVVLNNGVNQHAATVIVRDAHDNVIEGVPVELTVTQGEASIRGPVLNAALLDGSAAKSLSTNAAGAAASAIVSEEEGTFTVEAKIGSAAVSLGQKTVDFAPGSPSVENSSWTKSPAAGSVQVSREAPDAAYVVTVTVRSGNNLLVGDAAVRLTGVGAALPANLVIDEAPNAAGYWTTGAKTSDHYGQVVLHVRSTLAGDFPVAAQILPNAWPSLTAPATHTLSFAPGPICVPASGCAPDPGVPTTKVEVVTDGVRPDGTARDVARVQAHDRFGNPVPGAQVASAKAASAADLAVQPDIAATDANGRSTIWYTSTTPGAHLADVTVGGLLPPGSPVSLRFGVGDGDPATSSFTVTPAGPLVVGDTAASQFTVTTTVRDVFHDPAPGILVTVGLDRAGPTWGPGGATCTSAADGTCSVTLTSTVAGTYRVQPRLAAGAIGTPAAITHNAGPVCFTSASEPCSGDPATQTRVEVTKNHQRADGQATDEARVRLFDVHGNPVPGQTVTAAGQGADAADLVVRSIPASAADGTTVVPFTSDAFGWHTAKVSVVVDGQEVEVTHPQSDKSSPLALHFVRVGDVPAPVITSPVSGAIVNDPTPTVQGTGEPGAVVTLTDGADMIGQAVVWADGTWEHTPAMPLADGDHSLAATQTDKDGNVSDPSPAVDVTVDTVSPSAPTVDTSEPDEVRGTADPGDQVTVADADGQGLCATTADADGEWSCAPGAELRPGDEVTVTATDPAGNQTSVTVLVLEVTVSKAALTPGEAQTATGRFFQPGESVTAVVKPGSFAYGAATADDSGNVTFTWTIPETTPTGAYQVVLTGSLSGPGKVSFQLKEPIPATGTEAGPQTLWAAAAAGLFGSVLIVLGWRRRRDDDIDGPRRQA